MQFLVDAYGPFYSHCHPSELQGVLLECHQSSNGHVQVQKAKKNCVQSISSWLSKNRDGNPHTWPGILNRKFCACANSRHNLAEIECIRFTV